MKLPVLHVLRSFRASYWFVPSLMLLAAIGLGALNVWLDAGPAADLLDGVSWYQRSKPEGARQVLSTIAGSMITVTGVVFSITIVAISFAAGQYGPRILTNFMSDRGNQVTLGTFVATFAYSVVVLRTIHGGDSNFVPQLAVLVALLLALCSIAVLIFFIHHVPESMHINTVTARIGRQLLDAIEEEFPAGIADPPQAADLDEDRLCHEVQRLFAPHAPAVSAKAEQDGYLQALDTSFLLTLAGAHKLVIKVDRSPGKFVFKGQPIITAAPAANVGESFEAEARQGWTIGSKRTPDSDPLFLSDELVEIAARALSSGVNDPHTAATCVDWLASAAAKIATRQSPSPYRVDDGELRMVVSSPSFELHIERSFGQLRPYLARDLNATAHTLRSLASLGEMCCSAGQKRIVESEMEALTELAKTYLAGPSLDQLAKVAAATRAGVQPVALQASR